MKVRVDGAIVKSVGCDAVGAKVRLTATLKTVEEVTGGLQLTLAAVIEREGGDKPVCIAEPVYRYYGG